MRNYHLVGNLKMNPITRDAADRYLSGLREAFQGGVPESVSVSVAVPFPYLERFADALPEGVELVAQDVFWEREGSFTGQVSPAMLRDLGVRSVLVGHSERRLYGHETDEEISKKTSAALEAGLRAIVCIGETAEERDAGHEAEVLEVQADAALSAASCASADRIVIAYEPRWAIGTDRTPTAEEIFAARIAIRRSVAERLGRDAAERIPVLYGGSVKASLLREVCFEPGMDGVLVGRESLYPHEVGNMAHMLSECAREES